MKTLIVVAHLDDETFGMGGTLAEICMDGQEVKVVSLCHGRNIENSALRMGAAVENQQQFGFQLQVYPYYDMTLESLLKKDITKLIENEINSFKPERVFTVSENDLHQDHQIVSHCTKIACRPSRTSVKELYEFKIPGCQPYNETYYDTKFNIGNTMMLKRSMAERYTSETIPKLERIEEFKTIYRELKL